MRELPGKIGMKSNLVVAILVLESGQFAEQSPRDRDKKATFFDFREK
jgi:hypothetical protein